jgi:hypothetical protein
MVCRHCSLQSDGPDGQCPVGEIWRHCDICHNDLTFLHLTVTVGPDRRAPREEKNDHDHDSMIGFFTETERDADHRHRHRHEEKTLLQNSYLLLPPHYLTTMSAPPLMSDKENANRKQQLLVANGHPARRHDDEGVVVKSTDVAASARRKDGDPQHLCKVSSTDRSSFSRDSPVLLSSQLVLRRGEALEELFGIPRRPFVLSSGKVAPSSSSSSNQTMESYRELCESIVGGGEAAADDARAWKDVLAVATAAPTAARETLAAANNGSPQHEGLVLRAGACAD